MNPRSLSFFFREFVLHREAGQSTMALESPARRTVFRALNSGRDSCICRGAGRWKPRRREKQAPCGSIVRCLIPDPRTTPCPSRRRTPIR